MADQAVIAGFRPEAVSCVSSADITTPALVFQATIDRIEWLGAELFVYADIDLAAVMPARAHELFSHSNVNLVFRLEPSMSVQRGQVLQLQLDLQALQLFDWESGCNLHADFA